MIYSAIFLIAVVVFYGIDTTCHNIMKLVQNDPKIKKRLEIPFYSIFAYYKWRKEMKNAN